MNPLLPGRHNRGLAPCVPRDLAQEGGGRWLRRRSKAARVAGDDGAVRRFGRERRGMNEWAKPGRWPQGLRGIGLLVESSVMMSQAIIVDSRTGTQDRLPEAGERYLHLLRETRCAELAQHAL